MIAIKLNIFLTDQQNIVVKVTAQMASGLKHNAYYAINYTTLEMAKATIQAICHEEQRHYSRLQLGVSRTCSRVIVRVLHKLMVSLNMYRIDDSYDGMLSQKGAFNSIAKLNTNGVFYDTVEMHYVSCLSDGLYDWVRLATLRCRSYGRRQVVARGTQIIPIKPEKFYTLEREGVTEDLVHASRNRRVRGVKMGIELEFSYVRKLEGDPEYLCLKHDGSLPPRGRELTTRPDNYEEHIKNLTEWLDYNGRNLKVNNSCGMHVHVDKKHLPPDQLKMVRKRMYDEKNQAKYIRIAGREPNSYWNFGNDGRYTAVNNSNYNTVEFRMFSGTKSKHKIKRRLQWVKAMVNWANKPERIAELEILKEEEAKKKLASEQARRLKQAEQLIELKRQIERLRLELVNEIGPILWEEVALISPSRQAGYITYNPDSVRSLFPRRENRGFVIASNTALVAFTETPDLIWIHNVNFCYAIRLSEPLREWLRSDEMFVRWEASAGQETGFTLTAMAARGGFTPSISF